MRYSEGRNRLFGGGMFTQLSTLSITKILSISTMHTPAGGNSIARKHRSSWGLFLKYEGETEYVSGGKTYVSNARQMILLPKGSSYEWRCTQSGHYVVIEFESDLTSESLYSFDVADGDAMLKSLKDLEKIWLSKKPFYEMECLQGAYAILLKLVKTHEKGANYAPNAKKQRLLPALSYIHSHFTQAIKNEDLAKQCQISTIYFRKLFVDVYGLSPIKYIHHLRILRAKEMLRSDYGSISDIAISLGYNNIYEFSKAFKKHTGVPPSKYESLPF